MPAVNWNLVLNSVVFALVGVIVYALFFVILDKLTPYQLWREINEKQNTALAILIGAMAVGIAIIVAAAIHG